MNLRRAFNVSIFASVVTLLASCQTSSHEEMITILRDLTKKNYSELNIFTPETKLVYCDTMLKMPGNEANLDLLSEKATLLLRTSHEQQSVKIYEDLLKRNQLSEKLMPGMAIAYMRLGERSNCVLNHDGSSCIFPIKDGGVHQLRNGSEKAIKTYEEILRRHPEDLESRWLLNIAYMTLGRYPGNAPAEFVLPGLNVDTGIKVKPFTDVAADVGIHVNGRAGGSVVDDFNNDGYLDIVTSGLGIDDPMHYFQNNRNGTFSDLTEQSGLKGLTGGLNIQQMDYNNDGNIDIFVLRGAWSVQGFGNQPSSLLQNNGEGKFTDVTIPAGLLFFHPTQAAVWTDLNNDGWLDVFIGPENSGGMDAGGTHTCMLYMNNHDGTFTDVAKQAHCDITSFVKGVTSADYDNDGWKDIFISTLTGKKYLLKNKRKAGAVPDFEDVSARSGIDKNTSRTFTTWFYDYNNDGWADILIGDYQFSATLGYYAAAEALGRPVPNAGNIYLYKNNHDGTFADVTKETGLNKVVYSMGANFGDIDNDGWLDMYFGTGNPDFGSLMPNKLFKNIDGKRFADVTKSSRIGNLQKGHGVAFADIRNTGIQDIFIEMGGAFRGDSYTSSLYENPGYDNNWLSFKLVGIKANKAGIGSRVKLTFVENGIKRVIYKDVNSGGSFGSSPLRQEIGIGRATLINEMEITWAGSQTVQRFKNISPNRFFQITEGSNDIVVIPLKKLTYRRKPATPMCMPLTAKLK